MLGEIGIPRRTGLRGIRRPQPRLPELRADRGAGRARRLVRPDGRLGADLARRRIDRALGDRGAEARVAAAAVLGRGARLLRPDRARRRLRPGRPPHARRARPTRAGRSPATRCGSRWATSPTSPWSSPGPIPASEHKGLACFLVPTDQRRLQLAGDPRQARAALVRHRGDLARRGRGRRGRAARRGRRRLQGRDERPRQRPLQRRRRLRRDLRRLRRRLGRLRQGAPAVRRADRQLPARAGADRRHDREDGTPPGCSSTAPATSRTAAAATRSRPRSPSTTPPRRPSSARTRRSRCTADRATSTSTRSSATCATPGSPRSTRAPPRSRS